MSVSNLLVKWVYNTLKIVSRKVSLMVPSVHEYLFLYIPSRSVNGKFNLIEDNLAISNAL